MIFNIFYLRSGQANLKKIGGYYILEDVTWWNAFSFLHVAINKSATFADSNTKKALYQLVIRAIYKYVAFIIDNGCPKYRQSIVDSIKDLDWITSKCKIVSNTRFNIIETIQIKPSS